LRKVLKESKNLFFAFIYRIKKEDLKLFTMFFAKWKHAVVI